ncbi:hypothetical protein E2C01_062040 [Portunus trituberculatus]|uniref:Uncharacterized protein n=1 Tax=Portunus trituberculatus TaxID=210409 RepID=A0A5B7HGY5_PORTR|nr:hypothetical protein [Portunus trituberculatus]
MDTRRGTEGVKSEKLSNRCSKARKKQTGGKVTQVNAQESLGEQGRHRNAREDKTRQDKARQGKARQGKARQGKAKQGKARKGPLATCLYLASRNFTWH